MKNLFVILAMLGGINSYAETLLVKLKSPLDKKMTKNLGGTWEKFDKSIDPKDYFSTLYYYKTKNIISKSERKILKSQKNIISIEDIIEVSSSSIDIPEITTKISNDALSPFQWGLFFQGQKVYNELDDLNNLLIPGSKKSDIGLNVKENLDQKFSKNPVVAVIDTGVDYAHPDLKTNISINEVECEKGENGELSIPYLPEQSNDDNDKKGDCKGWNFTGSKKEGNNRPEDTVGHGTHIAGIISAVKGNEIGLSGVSNRIKILPIKVLSNEKEDAQAIGTSDRLSKAINYAVDMKVDVINLSLGWPLSFDKDHLREAVMKAIKAGITVVSAAGNNDHSEPIMPCAYEGVICVGSSDPDTKMSDFSNFGAHVDVLAPGNNILSTFPIALDELYFDVDGYEIKSGTSQSAPYVSALAAAIRGISPGLSADEVKSKIFASARTPYVKGMKFASGGIINFETALATNKAVIKPNLKGFNRVKVDFIKRSFEFDLEFNDYGFDKEKLIVELSGDKEISLDQSSFDLGTQRSIKVKGKLKSLDLNLLQKFSLKLSYQNFKEEYEFEKRFFVDFEDLQTTKSFEILGANPKSVTEFATINENHFPYDFPYYYTVTKDKKGRFLSIFTKEGNVIKNIGTTLIKDATQIMSIHRVDLNLDGKADILVRTVNETVKKDEKENSRTEEPKKKKTTSKTRNILSLFEGSENISRIKSAKPLSLQTNKQIRSSEFAFSQDPTPPTEEEVEKEQSIVFHYFSEKLRPLFSEVEMVDGKRKRTSFSSMTLGFENVILQDLDNFSFGKVDFGRFGKILVPVYLGFTQALPDADRNPNPFARLRQRSFSERIYYYEPKIEKEKVTLTTRTLNDNKFVDNLKRKIKFRPYEQIFAVKFLKQSFEDIKNGKISLLLSHESERKQARNYILSIPNIMERKWNVEKTTGPGLNLSQFITERGVDLNAENILAHNVDQKIVGYEKSTRLSWEEYSIDGNFDINYVSIEQKDVNDSLEFPIKTYFDDKGTFRFYLTPSRIFLERKDGENKTNYSYPVHVSSFLPGMLFREQHYPITFASDEGTTPALYVNSTQIASRNIYLLKATDTGIVAPIKFNINIPKNCRALNPVVIDKYKYEYSIQCFLDRGKSKIFFVPLED